VKRNLHNDEGGQALIMTALCMIVLLGFVGFAVDAGLYYHTRTNLHKVADAAAIAGAADIYWSTVGQGDWHQAALDSAAVNGVPDGVAGAHVDPHLGSVIHPGSDTVEVIVTVPEARYFSKIFSPTSTQNVSARAAAGLGQGNPCIYAMGHGKKNDGIIINGTGGKGALNMPNCGVSDNTDLDLNGNSTMITAKYISVAGTDSGSCNTDPADGSKICTVPDGKTHTSPISDPLAGISPPSQPSAATCTGVLTGKGTNATCTYTNLPVPSGSYNNLTVRGTSTFSGLYWINGTLDVSTSSTTKSIATFYVGPAGDVTSLNAYLEAPSGGVVGTWSPTGCDGVLLWYRGVGGSKGLVYSPTDSPNLTGILYLPNDSITFGGNTAAVFNTAIIASNYTINGAVTINGYVMSGGPNPFSSAVLVE
jgi:hypothetical protein